MGDGGVGDAGMGGGMGEVGVGGDDAGCRRPEKVW